MFFLANEMVVEMVVETVVETTTFVETYCAVVEPQTNLEILEAYFSQQTKTKLNTVPVLFNALFQENGPKNKHVIAWFLRQEWFSVQFKEADNILSFCDFCTIQLYMTRFLNPTDKSDHVMSSLLHRPCLLTLDEFSTVLNYFSSNIWINIRDVRFILRSIHEQSMDEQLKRHQTFDWLMHNCSHLNNYRTKFLVKHGQFVHQDVQLFDQHVKDGSVDASAKLLETKVQLCLESKVISSFEMMLYDCCKDAIIANVTQISSADRFQKIRELNVQNVLLFGNAITRHYHEIVELLWNTCEHVRSTQIFEFDNIQKRFISVNEYTGLCQTVVTKEIIWMDPLSKKVETRVQSLICLKNKRDDVLFIEKQKKWIDSLAMIQWRLQHFKNFELKQFENVWIHHCTAETLESAKIALWGIKVLLDLFQQDQQKQKTKKWSVYKKRFKQTVQDGLYNAACSPFGFPIVQEIIQLQWILEKSFRLFIQILTDESFAVCRKDAEIEYMWDIFQMFHADQQSLMMSAIMSKNVVIARHCTLSREDCVYFLNHFHFEYNDPMKNNCKRIFDWIFPTHRDIFESIWKNQETYYQDEKKLGTGWLEELAFYNHVTTIDYLLTHTPSIQPMLVEMYTEDTHFMRQIKQEFILKDFAWCSKQVDSSEVCCICYDSKKVMFFATKRCKQICNHFFCSDCCSKCLEFCETCPSCFRSFTV